MTTLWQRLLNWLAHEVSAVSDFSDRLTTLERKAEQMSAELELVKSRYEEFRSEVFTDLDKFAADLNDLKAKLGANPDAADEAALAAKIGADLDLLRSKVAPAPAPATDPAPAAEPAPAADPAS